jgi:hypothetical protein
MKRHPWLVLAPLFLLPACHSSITTQPSAVADNGLAELAQVYEYRAASNMGPPRRLEDLNEHDAALPVAYAKIQSGDYIVYWGVGLSSSGRDVVLAYEKDVPASGGLVLMQDGTVKSLTAAEFQAARKAR